MTAVTPSKIWEQAPNNGLKQVIFTTPNTADATNTVAITLSDYGINATGLLIVEGWVHNTDGSVIKAEADTTSVTAGVLTVTIAAGTDNDMRVIRITGTATPGVFS
jgi:hypothetical protein